MLGDQSHDWPTDRRAADERNRPQGHDSGEDANCRVVLLADRNQMLAAPTATSEAAATSRVGQIDVMSIVTPNVVDASTIVRMPLE